MGSNINLDRIRNIAKQMSENLEKEQEENKNKEKKQEYQNLVESMDERKKELELEKNITIYNQNKFSLDNKQKEILNLKKNSEVKRYITLLSQVEDLEKEQKFISDKVSILEQTLCDHNLLYLMTFPKKTMTYIPTFRCLCCGKSINGFINEEQVVINQEFLDENEDSYYGNLTEYLSENYKYHDLLDAGESLEEIIVEMQDELHQNHQGKKKIVKILRKKED